MRSRDNLGMWQLQLFSTAQLATMRDRTAARNYSAERDRFRREHERHRKWGLTQRYAEKTRRLRATTAPAPQPPTATAIDRSRQAHALSSPPARNPAPVDPARQPAPEATRQPTVIPNCPAGKTPTPAIPARPRPRSSTGAQTKTAGRIPPHRRAHKRPRRLRPDPQGSEPNRPPPCRGTTGLPSAEPRSQPRGGCRAVEPSSRRAEGLPPLGLLARGRWAAESPSRRAATKPPSRWTTDPPGILAVWSPSHRVTEPPGYRAAGRAATEPPGYRPAGPFGRSRATGRAAGPPSRRAEGQPARWASWPVAAGLPSRRAAGRQPSRRAAGRQPSRRAAGRQPSRRAAGRQPSRRADGLPTR
jgi:hypothetical protein